MKALSIFMIIGAIIMLISIILYFLLEKIDENKSPYIKNKNKDKVFGLGAVGFITAFISFMTFMAKEGREEEEEEEKKDKFSVAWYEGDPLNKCPPAYRADDYIDPALAGSVQPPDRWDKPFDPLYFIKKGDEYHKKAYIPLKESFPLCPIDYRLQDTDTCVRDFPDGKKDIVPSRGCRTEFAEKHGFSDTACSNAICGGKGKLVGDMCVRDDTVNAPARACRKATAFPHRFSDTLCRNDCERGYSWNDTLKKCATVCPVGANDFGTYCKSKTPARDGARSDIN
jgi:hypothetical protein